MPREEAESVDTDFFDRNAVRYGDVRPWFYDFYFIEFMKKNLIGHTLLDVGAGSGTFASLVKKCIPDMRVTAVDPSARLLSQLNDRSIRKVVGKLPDLSLNPADTFLFIHVKEVLHHLVGKTVNESRDTVTRSLLALKDHLNDSGFLMIHELYWETYIVPSVSRTLTFYLLSICTKLHIRLPYREHLERLLVCFYTTSELENMLKDCGFVIVRSKQYPFSDTTFKRVLLLRRWGRMLYIVRKENNKQT